MSDIKKRMRKGVRWATIGSLVNQGSGLLISFLLVRLIGLEALGLYALITSTVATFGMVAAMATGVTTTKFVAEYRTKDTLRAGNFYILNRALTFWTSCVVALSVIFLKDFIAQIFKQPEMANLLLISVPLLVLNPLSSVQQACLSGCEAYDKIAHCNIALGFLRMAFSIVGAYAYGVEGALLAYILSQGVFNILLSKKISDLKHGGIIKIPEAIDFSDLKTVFRFALPSFLSNLIVGPANWFVNLLLSRQPQGLEYVGLFNLGVQWQNLIKFVPNRILDVGLAVLSNLHRKSDLKEFRAAFLLNLSSVMKVTLLVSVPLLLANKVVLSLYGISYSYASIAFCLILASGIFHIICRVFTQAIIAAGEPEVELKYTLFRASLTVAAAMLLVKHGVVGVSISYLFAYVALCVLLVTRFKPILKGSPSAPKKPGCV